MSCKECDEIQKVIDVLDIDICYIRVENANIAVIGCKKHIKILIEQLRKKK